MKYAVIELAVEIHPQAVSVLVDAGLKVTGSLDCGLLEDGRFDCIRLMVEEEDYGKVLPAECIPELALPGFTVVMLTFSQEAYGSQRLVKIQSAEIVGHLVRDLRGKRRFLPVSPKDQPVVDFEKEAAKARAAAILARVGGV
ncbi:hypothetical protein [Bradyrhizobium sp. SZCCHNR1020]|uniref:hypothetical protein n=1 Tax=Bradyrhizobium sp. SZCCHNR1020 TaxID=3057343 RepID=UPI0029164E16|nr:hypothetical protein [Bradyrhizobium sp. SZCCHNR1020]